MGFIGLPPQGAVPSTPVDGELVFHYEGQPDHLKIGPSYQAWVYADGRLIWWMDGSPSAGGLPEGANDWTTGYLEQRLTSTGVELLLRRTPRNALFGHGGVLTLPRYPASWLPPRAWADREIKAYVPSRYAACYGGWPPSVVPPSRILAELPAPAADLLRSGYSAGVTLNTTGTAAPSEVGCSNLGTEEARALVDAFGDVGVEEGGPGSPWRLDYHFEFTGPNGAEAVLIWFEPVLPDGERACSRSCSG